MRGRFRPATKVHLDMISSGYEMFKNEEEVKEDNIQVLFELTLKDLTADGKISDKDFVDRAELLCSMGYTVMISNYLKHYKMIEYLSGISKNFRLGVILGVYNLQNIFNEKYYDTLEGGLLEAFGRGFGRNVKMFVYPAINVETGEIYHLNNFETKDYLMDLLNYMKKANKIEAIEKFDQSLLHIISDDVLAKINAAVSDWENDVPKEVVEAIKKHELFGFKAERFEKLEK